MVLGPTKRKTEAVAEQKAARKAKAEAKAVEAAAENTGEELFFIKLVLQENEREDRDNA